MNVYVIIWQYDIRPAARDEFERAYGPDGAWATFFRASRDFLGTQLLRDIALPDRYVTLDHWRTEVAFVVFTTERKADYEALDRHYESLTTTEARLGAFWRTTQAGHDTPK